MGRLTDLVCAALFAAALGLVWAVTSERAAAAVLAASCPQTHQGGSIVRPGDGTVRVLSAEENRFELRCVYRADRPSSAWNRTPGPTRVFQVWAEFVRTPGYVTACVSAPDSREADRGRIISASHAAKVEYAIDDPTIDRDALHEFARGILAGVESDAIQCPGLSRPVPPTPDLSGKALCAEIRRSRSETGFTDAELATHGVPDPDHTRIDVDHDQLRGQIVDAIERYNRENADTRAHVTLGLLPFGLVGTALWLVTEGGHRTPLTGERVFSQWSTGRERALRDVIVRYSREVANGGPPHRLTVGEVFYLALELSGGNVRTAALMAHNTLRALARGQSNGEADKPFTGVEGEPGFENTYLQALRVPRQQGDERRIENGGPWYHFFGTMYFELEARGDWGPAVALALGSVGGVGLVQVTGLVSGVFMSGPSGEGTKGISRLANNVEQAVRTGRPDPEKFCFNVWGGQIGALLYRELPGVAARRFSEPFSSFDRPTLDRPTFGAAKPVRYLSGSGSPFSVRWSGDGYAALLDQGAEAGQLNFYGGAPFLIQPFPEPDGTWGSVWATPDGEQPAVAFEAMRSNATIHLFRMDMVDRTVATYVATATRVGERFTWSTPADGSPPELRNERGDVFLPLIHVVPDDALLTGTPVLGLGAIAGGLLVAFAGLLWARRGRGRL